ncbi:nucleotidyltransferase family protein [Naasia aerilata]|uniref:MobA-like NTP transferase domain-containing protein n=1 Tax=Naasia aerilata TaxID=1162966 RepID=A0ABM8GBR0_9MICO|nr:NTP transferase domain-containing protein [Naasia aerilata]BDZ45661.1 hypothetical protein GCM10025866_15700 [Naasia aerilata]
MAAATLPGVILAAGAGTRFGMPKALARSASGEPWLHLAAAALRAGGAGPILAVLGAEAEAARRLLPEGVSAVVADDWADGVGASLAAGLAALEGSPEIEEAPAAVVTLVDLPGLPSTAVRRLIAAAGGRAADRSALLQATYAGRPGHPVVLGRAHWAPLRGTLDGDTGARPYLLTHGVTAIECGDLWSGEDVDRAR